MTTGRINQVTIVRRGWPTDARRRRRDDPSYWWRHGDAPSAAPSAGPTTPCWQSAFPLFVHQGTARRTTPLRAVRRGRPSRRTRAQRQPCRRPLTRGYLPSLSGRTCHRPAIHRAHPAPTTGDEPLAGTRHPRYAGPQRGRLHGGRRPL
jgi:hypothetical protein